MKNRSEEKLDVVNQQIKEIVGIYRAKVSALGISENEFWIWYTLIIMDEEYTQQDICETWSLSKQTVNTIIKNMVGNNFIYLEVIPGTKNRKSIKLTEEGRKYGESVIFPIVEAEHRVIERFPEEELNSCISSVAKYIRLLKEEMGV